MSMRSNRFQFSAAVMMMMSLLFSGTLSPAAAQGLTVEKAVICKNVVNRAPVGVGNRFPATVDRLYFFTKILGAEQPRRITHVWYFDGAERDRISLAVGGSPWRTYSSKRVRTVDVGSWHVDVLDAGGNILYRVAFEVVN
ncbi:MAG: DUF2914 domain-containing protein [Desulfobacterales bacterium]